MIILDALATLGIFAGLGLLDVFVLEKAHHQHVESSMNFQGTKVRMDGEHLVIKEPEENQTSETLSLLSGLGAGFLIAVADWFFLFAVPNAFSSWPFFFFVLSPALPIILIFVYSEVTHYKTVWSLGWFILGEFVCLAISAAIFIFQLFGAFMVSVVSSGGQTILFHLFIL